LCADIVWRQTRATCSNSHIIASLDSQCVYSWGTNDCGQLGTGDRTPHGRAVAIPQLKGLTQHLPARLRVRVCVSLFVCVLCACQPPCACACQPVCVCVCVFVSQPMCLFVCVSRFVCLCLSLCVSLSGSQPVRVSPSGPQPDPLCLRCG
jgi:hypothetical protein